MKKQAKQFLILFVILIIAVGILTGFRIYNKGQEKKDAEKADTSVMVTEIPLKDINAFSYQLEGENISFHKEGDTWICDERPELSIDGGKIEAVLGKLERVKADGIVKDPESMDVYGLVSPSNTIQVTYGEKSTTFYIGNYNDMAGCYYFKTDMADTVYTVSSGIAQLFTDTADSFAVEENQEISANTIDN